MDIFRDTAELANDPSAEFFIVILRVGQEKSSAQIIKSIDDQLAFP